MVQETRSTKKKSVAFLLTNDKEAEKEIRETSPFTIATNNITKHLNTNPVILNHREQKVGSSLECTCTGNHFINLIPVAQTLGATVN